MKNPPSRPQSESGFDTHCRIDGCQRLRRKSDLLCRECWYSVPADVRSEVWRSWKLLCDLDAGDPNYRQARQRWANAAKHAIRLAQEAFGQEPKGFPRRLHPSPVEVVE